MRKIMMNLMLVLLVLGLVTPISNVLADMKYRIPLPRTKPAQEAAISVIPLSQNVPLGSGVDINITVAEVIDLAGFEFKLFWSNAVLNISRVSCFLPWSPYLVVRNETLQNFNSTHGRYWFGAAALAPVTPFTGNYTVLRAAFKTIGTGLAQLVLSDTKLGDDAGNPIPHGRNDGSVRVLWESTQYSWLMFRHNLGHTGYTLSPDPNANQTLWTYTTGSVVGSSSAVADGRVYIGSNDNNIYCLDALTGGVIWNYTTGDDVGSSPAVADGRVYIGSDDFKVYCLNASNGAFIWSYTTGNRVFSSPAISYGKVYVGSYDNRVYCLDTLTGGVIWNYATGGAVSTSPAVADGRVYVGSGDSKVYCLDAATGAHIWSYTTGSYVGSSPAVADGRVYVGSGDSEVYCLDASTGANVWSYTTGGSVFSSPAVAGGRVYVGSHDNKTYCLNASTGAKVWSYATGGSVFSSPAVADGVVFVGSGDNRVYAFGNILQVPEDYPTIQKAVDEAPQGATIIVEPGVYEESIVINKTLTILGKKGSRTTFSGGGSGIGVIIQSTAPGTVIANVMVTYFDKGILVNNTRDCMIYDNIMFSMTGSGIIVQGNNAANNLIQNNYVYSNNIAINLAAPSTANTVYNNTISQNNVGLKLETNGNTVYGNTISQNTVGIQVLSSANVVYWNSFVNNLQVNVGVGVMGNVWDNGYPSGGNYWSDYSGVDANSDGIGDTPYVIDGSNQDKYPLMDPVHEIAVTAVATSKTVVGQGYSVKISVTVANRGRLQENVKLTLYADAFIITKLVDNFLASRMSTTIVFTWNTAGWAKGAYTISAVAAPVLGEMDVGDNTWAGGVVTVAMVGDVVPNGAVDIYDIIYLATSFGAEYGKPPPPGAQPYKPNADIIEDNTIDVYDLISIGVHFGEVDQ